MLSFLALIFAVIALFKISSLKKRILHLETQLHSQPIQENNAVSAALANANITPTNAEFEPSVTTETHQEADAEPLFTETALATFSQPISDAQPASVKRKTPTSEKVDIVTQRIAANLKQHWLVWAGGLALLIGVAYLMQVISEYIEFTPIMRIGLAFVVSTLVLFLGHKLDKKESQHSEIGFAYVPAVISAAGCMGLYSTVIIGYLLYDFLSPVMSLGAMGAISIFTLALHLRLGPLMAILGLVAGYTAPLWFSSEASNSFALAGYVSFVAFSGLVLASYVKKHWLYSVTLIPFLFWLWTIAAVVESSIVSWWGLCFIPLATYFVLVVPQLGWKANHSHGTIWNPKYHISEVATFSVVTLMMITFRSITELDQLIVIIILALGLAWYPRIHGQQSNKDFSAQLIGAIIVVIFTLVVMNPALLSQGYSLLILALALSAVMARSVDYYQTRATDNIALLIAIVTPPLLCVVSWGINDMYALVDSMTWSLYWFAVIIGYGATSARISCINAHLLAMLHLIYLCILFALFDGSDLTVLLAAQALFASWQINRQQFQPAFWAVKVVASLVIIRMTLSVALPEFHHGLLDQGGYLLIYAVIAALLYLGLRYIRAISTSLSLWLEGALLHLTAITLVAQTHYWMIEPNTPWYQFDVNHALIYVCESLLMVGVYQYRAQSANAARMLYLLYSQALAVMAVTLIAMLNTYYSPLYTEVVSGQAWPIFNKLTLGWLIPALLIIGLQHYKLLTNIANSRITNVLGYSLASIWLLLSIRQFWQTDSITLFVPTSMAEQISYSIAGIIIGALCTLYGVFRYKAQANMVGLTVLATVAVKVVIVDTAALEGLYKALSYLALGSVLVACGWVFQKLKLKREEMNASASQHQ
jgi:uncharacterized membrane protein